MASTSCLVAMTSASHGEGRQFNPGEVYTQCSWDSAGVPRPLSWHRCVPFLITSRGQGAAYVFIWYEMCGFSERSLWTIIPFRHEHAPIFTLRWHPAEVGRAKRVDQSDERSESDSWDERSEPGSLNQCAHQTATFQMVGLQSDHILDRWLNHAV